MSIENVKVMIVEDDMIIRLDLERALQLAEFNIVATASTGKSAVEKAQVHRPNVILMDIGLKGSMNGIEAAKLIQQTKETKIIFLSGNSDVKTNEEALKLTPFSFVIKPVNASVLVDLLNTLV